jgi:hypothetical protein
MARRPSFLLTIGRIFVATLLFTALAFAITLLVSIVSLAITSAVHHSTLDMSIAYRVIGVRAAIVAAPLAFIVVGAHQLRDYFRARSAAHPLKFAR